jgi:L-amino acid N-acyltransferase YncA
MIRQAAEHDAAGVLGIYEPIVRDTPISFETEPPTEEEMAARIARSHEWLIIESDHRIIGYAYAAPFHRRAAYRWSVEISIYLARDARGSGLGRKLLSDLLDSLSRRGFVNAFAGIALPNPVSVRLFESFGFEKVAQQRNVGFKLGAWHDVGWWQRQLRAPTSPPPDISPRAPVVRG